MAVIFDPSVLQCIDGYTTILLGLSSNNEDEQYEVSSERAFEKIDNLYNSLNGLDKSISHRICMYADLGQEFDRRGNPIHRNLKRYNYKDESGYQWAFAYILHENGDVEITKMVGANKVVKESRDNRHIYIKEPELRRYVRKLIRKTIDKILIS